tara:strand:- start:740 stop:1309 length:570 start_codon:yes stop_codon:yes gene_type:complete
MSFKLKNTESYLISFVGNLKRLSIRELERSRFRKYSSGRTINEPLNASGNLKDSFTVESKYIKNKLSVNMRGNSYGEKVDEGTKAGTNPSVSQLVNWINKKPVKLTDAKGRNLTNITPEGKNRIANQIAQKINREGIKPTNFLTNLVDAQFAKLATIDRAILKDINTDLDSFMQSIGYTKNGETFKIQQ